MAESHRLDEAFDRFDSALRQFEAALVRLAEGSKRVSELENEAEALRRDRSKLSHELDLVRNKAGEIVEGEDGKVKRQKDIWTFERVMGSDDPNWRLVATGE